MDLPLYEELDVGACRVVEEQPKPNPQPLRPLALVTDWRPHIGALRGLCTTSYDSPHINLGVLPIGCITPKSVSGNSVSGQLLELDVANHVRHVVNLVTVALRESNAPLIRVSDKVCGRSG